MSFWVVHVKVPVGYDHIIWCIPLLYITYLRCLSDFSLPSTKFYCQALHFIAKHYILLSSTNLYVYADNDVSSGVDQVELDGTTGVMQRCQSVEVTLSGMQVCLFIYLCCSNIECSLNYSFLLILLLSLSCCFMHCWTQAIL